MTPPTRRQLCRSVLAIAATSILGPAAAFADPEAAPDTQGAMAANAALASALTGATTRVDAFNYYGIGNMGTLVESVAYAQSLAASLAENERPFLRPTFPAESARILQGARDYLAATTGSANPAALASIREAMSEARHVLSAGASGTNLVAATLMTMAFTSEFGAARRLTNDRETLLALLDEYRIWTDAMRNMLGDSIPFRRAAAARSHDEGLLALAQSPYGKRLGIGSYVIRGTQPEKRIADPCVVFYTRYMENPARARGGLNIPDDHRLNIFWNPTFVPWVIAGYSRIKMRDDARFGTRLIEFSPGEGKAIDTTGIIGGLRPPIGGEFCYAITSRGVNTASQAMRQADDHPSLQEDRKDRAAIVEAVKNANACRIEIALSGRAMGMLRLFDEMREFLERQL